MDMLGMRVTCLEKICWTYKGELEGLRNEVKMMLTQVNAISNWISTRFGVDIIDKTFPPSSEVTKPNKDETAKSNQPQTHLTRRQTRLRSRNSSVMTRFRRRWKSTGSLNLNISTRYKNNGCVQKVNTPPLDKTDQGMTLVCDTNTMDKYTSEVSKEVHSQEKLLKGDDLCFPMPSVSSIESSGETNEKMICRATKVSTEKNMYLQGTDCQMKDSHDMNPNKTKSESTSSHPKQEIFKELTVRLLTGKESRRGRPKKRPEEKVQNYKVKTPMVCDECGKVLKGAGSLRCHKKIHSNLRPYECKECGKAFRMKHHLDFHIMVHEGDKKWTCKFCNKGFLARRDLLRHERTHTGEKPFACGYPDCTKTFNVKQHLTLHIRTHTGERPYRCLTCNKTFTQANSLRIHRKIHGKGGGDKVIVKERDVLLNVPEHFAV